MSILHPTTSPLQSLEDIMAVDSLDLLYSYPKIYPVRLNAGKQQDLHHVLLPVLQPTTLQASYFRSRLVALPDTQQLLTGIKQIAFHLIHLNELARPMNSVLPPLLPRKAFQDHQKT